MTQAASDTGMIFGWQESMFNQLSLLGDISRDGRIKMYKHMQQRMDKYQGVAEKTNLFYQDLFDSVLKVNSPALDCYEEFLMKSGVEEGQVKLTINRLRKLSELTLPKVSKIDHSHIKEFLIFCQKQAEQEVE